ncbi:MAG: hypothetical protein ACTSVZ_09105 [Promethearchaeota archaeon]
MAPTQDYQILTSNYAEQTATFMQRVDPVFRGNRQASDYVFDENYPYLAIMKNNQILSIAGLWVDPEMGIINIVGNDPDL